MGHRNMLTAILLWEFIEYLRNALARPEFWEVAQVYPKGTVFHRHICWKMHYVPIII